MQQSHKGLDRQRMNPPDQAGVHVLHDLLPRHRVHDGIRVLPREKYPNPRLRPVSAQPPNQPRNRGIGKEDGRFINKEDGSGRLQRSSQCRRVGTQGKNRRCVFVGEIPEGKHQQLGVGGKGTGPADRFSHP